MTLSAATPAVLTHQQPQQQGRSSRASEVFSLRPEGWPPSAGEGITTCWPLHGPQTHPGPPMAHLDDHIRRIKHLIQLPPDALGLAFVEDGISGLRGPAAAAAAGVQWVPVDGRESINQRLGWTPAEHPAGLQQCSWLRQMVKAQELGTAFCQQQWHPTTHHHHCLAWLAVHQGHGGW
jgi:hypothetical protein